MECPELVAWLGAEALLAAYDAALAVLRHRLSFLKAELRRLRKLVRWYKRLRDQSAAGSVAERRWERRVQESRENRNMVEREFYRYLNRYLGYRAFHNELHGLAASSRWRALPAAARRGYPGA